ncbi:MAG: flippase-like domain-containing protein [Saprospiraceae bacterium]|nr:flippase-like domain-containing protein [Saprospiraceae bacterium]
MSRRFSRYRLLDLTLKGGLLFLLGMVIYKQVFEDDHWHDLLGQLQSNPEPKKWIFLILTVLLIPVNWGLETKKWLSLLPHDFGLSFWNSLRAVLMGIAISLITPNRIGEYGGRILLVRGRRRWDAVLATLVGSLAQMLILLCGGFIGLIIYGRKYLDLEIWQFRSALFLTLILVLTGFYAFFNIARFEGFVMRLARRWKWAKHLLRIRNYSQKRLLTGLQWAGFRYLIYVLQYLLVLYFFGVKPPIIEGFAAIATIYLIQTSIPLPPLIAIFARGELALLIWSVYSEDSASILAASLSLFILNLTIPALLGAAILVQINVLKSLGYESSE